MLIMPSVISNTANDGAGVYVLNSTVVISNNVVQSNAGNLVGGLTLDGSTITLAADEPAVAKLKPGSILWIWDIAVRKVDSVQTVGDVIKYIEDLQQK